MTRVGIVTGMLAESGCLSRALDDLPHENQPLLYCAAASSARAYEGACALVARGATALVSFGIAGGLQPDLLPGALVLADAVIDLDGRRWTTTETWRETLHHEIESEAGGAVLASPTAIVSVSGKAALHARTGAVVVDMESGGVARAAAEAGVPFLVVRVVADPAHRHLPPSALAGLGPDGRRQPLAAFAALMRRPGDTMALLRLGRDSRTALRRLRGVASRGRSLFLLAPGA